MAHKLDVTLIREGAAFMSGSFDVSEDDYKAVKPLLAEINLTRDGAEDLLIGYMHAQEIGQMTEQTGKMAMVAATFILAEGEKDIVIHLDARSL